MADVILRGVRLASGGGGELGDPADPAAELVFTNAHVSLEVIAGPPDDDGSRELEGFYLVATEAAADGAPAEDAVRVRIPALPETMRLLASSVLDYLDHHREKRADLSVASAEEIVHLNRAQRRRSTARRH